MSTAGDWIEYRLFCITESAWVSWILKDSDPAPTTCSHDSAHTINAASVAEFNRRSENEVTVKEEYFKTGGKWQTTTIDMTAPSSQLTKHSTTWRWGVGVLSFFCCTGAEHAGDEIDVFVGPDTPVGAITSDVAPGDRVLTVSDTVLGVASPGYLVSLSDGVQSEALGYLEAVDRSAKTITVENSSTLSFSAAGPTYVRITAHVVKNFTLGMSWGRALGESKIGASYIQPNMAIEVHYTNRAPPLKLGTITRNVVAGQSVIHVDQLTLEALHYGCVVDLWDGENREALGTVLEVNTMSETLTVSAASARDFDAASPTYILKSAKCVHVELELLE